MHIDATKPPQRQYKSLIYMGRVPKRSNLKMKDNPFHMDLSKNIKYLGPLFNELKRLAADKFVMVEPSVQNVNLTIESFDDPKFGPFRDRFYQTGCEFLMSQYGHIFNDCIATDEETSSYIDWTKSGGYHATTYNILTKGDLIKDERFLKSDYHLNPELTIPIVSVAVKRELKLKQDVLINKIRLFFISEFHLCKEQIRFGKRSSLRLKNLKWSAYGFSPFRGGVHKLALRLLSKPCRFYYDVSGWDKFIPLMKDLFDIIRRLSNIPDHLKDKFDWMMQHTAAFICALWDGDIMFKNYGNCSGSGTTTRDNILMHIIIASAFLTEAYFIKNGSLPSFELLAEQIVKLFGDDSVFAVDEEFDYVLYRKDEDDGFLRTFFKRYGMKLKFLYGGTDFPIEKMEFLGFRFHNIHGRYYPYYDPVRLATSFIHTNDKCDMLASYVSKCFVLTLMGYATEYRDTFLDAYKHLIISIQKIDNLKPELQSFANIGPLTEEILETFYSGLESSLVDFSFFESTLEEVGIKENLL